MERRAIADVIRGGGRRNEVARRFRRSPSTVSKIAAAEGLEFDRSNTKKATEARRSYARNERLELLDQAFERADEILTEIQEPGD